MRLSYEMSLATSEHFSFKCSLAVKTVLDYPASLCQNTVVTQVCFRELTTHGQTKLDLGTIH